ncbi:MAG: 50S ribosomal protein L6 [Chloroflexota bacterium]|nr:MAG: 50S ribosomal protein L6 [Chloroflexota bacterium]
MSRIGKKPIPVPDKVSVSIEEKRRISVKGPKGELQLDLPPDMTVTQENGALLVHRPSDERRHRALHGLTRALIANMVQGVSEGFRRSLIVEGVGYSGELRGKDLVLRLGYSHEIVVTPPENITFSVEGRNPTTIHVDGIDKQVVGQVAANIRELRPPEPYLGKGIRYAGEQIRRKAGKTGK